MQNKKEMQIYEYLKRGFSAPSEIHDVAWHCRLSADDDSNENRHTQ